MGTGFLEDIGTDTLLRGLPAPGIKRNSILNGRFQRRREQNMEYKEISKEEVKQALDFFSSTDPGNICRSLRINSRMPTVWTIFMNRLKITTGLTASGQVKSGFCL